MPIFKSLEEAKSRRRRLLRRRFVSFLLVGTGGYFAYRWWRSRPQALIGREVSYLTPNRDFYSVAIRPGFRPQLKADSWRLRVEGPAVSRDYGLDELRRGEVVKVTRTLCCVGNPVGGTAMGNAEWTAVPLATVLDPVRGGVPADWRVTFHAMDGFYSSVPLAVALDAETLLAWEMNGVDLPPRHGYPLRVLIPGRYGMKQPRWLEKITVQPGGSGYWERRGWCSECRVHMLSRIDSARPVSDGSWVVRGVAFCGANRVGGVEISADDGARWQTARLLDPALPNAWVRWEARWQPPGAGEYVLGVRVRDGAGNRQEEAVSGAWPSGATGLHRVIVRVPAG